MPGEDFSSLFDFLPIGAYRTRPDGTLLRANRALAALNGYADEAEMLAAVRHVGAECYHDPAQRESRVAALERDGRLIGAVSRFVRHRTREPIWVHENSHVVRDDGGAVLYYEGTIEDVTARIDSAAALADSERRLREITAQVPGFVFRLQYLGDRERRFVFVSDGVRDLFGVDPERLLGDHALMGSFEHPDDRDRVWREIAAARAERRPLQSEFRIVLADGSVKWVQLASAPAGDDGSGADVRVGVMLDITPRKQAEAALRASEERWKLALEASGNGVWDWNLAAGSEIVSPRLLQMYGLTDEAHGNDPAVLDRITHPDDVAQMLADRRAHLDGLTPSYLNEHRMQRADGRWLHVQTRGLVIERDADGAPVRMIGTHTDISAQKEAESLRRDRDRTAAAQKAQTAFLSRVSHELRTPLNAIIGFAQLLELEPPGGERQRNWLAAILGSGRHLLALVNDLLDLSSAQTGQVHFARSAVDVAAAARDAWTMHAADAVEAGVAFVDELPPPATLHALADPTRLKQVLSNLLSNAIKYNRRGGRVAVAAAARAGGRVAITVADTGAGLDDAQRARLFNPFERAGAQHTQVAGTGLGLALSKQLVEAMGGTVAVDSTPGAGSTFSVELPAP